MKQLTWEDYCNLTLEECEQHYEKLIKTINMIYTGVNYIKAYKLTNIKIRKPINKIKNEKQLQDFAMTDEAWNKEVSSKDALQGYYQSIIRIYDYDWTFDFEEVNLREQAAIELYHIPELKVQDVYYWFDAVVNPEMDVYTDQFVQPIHPKEFYVFLPPLVHQTLDCIKQYDIDSGGSCYLNEASIASYERALRNLLERYLMQTLPVTFI